MQHQHAHQSQQAPDMLHMIKQQQEQIELLKNQLNPNFNHQNQRNNQATPSEDISFSRPPSSKNRYRNQNTASRIEVPDNISGMRSFSRASTCSNRSKAPKPAMRKLLPTFERSPKLHVRRLASLMFPRSEHEAFSSVNLHFTSREEKVSRSEACSSVTNETDGMCTILSRVDELLKQVLMSENNFQKSWRSKLQTKIEK